MSILGLDDKPLVGSGDDLRNAIKGDAPIAYIDGQGFPLDPNTIDWIEVVGNVRYVRSDGVTMVKVLYHRDLYPPKNQIDHVFPDTRPPPFWQVMLLAVLLVAWMLVAAR